MCKCLQALANKQRAYEKLHFAYEDLHRSHVRLEEDLAHFREREAKYRLELRRDQVELFEGHQRKIPSLADSVHSPDRSYGRIMMPRNSLSPRVNSAKCENRGIPARQKSLESQDRETRGDRHTAEALERPGSRRKTRPFGQGGSAFDFE
mmetsp:Transcript_4511/g.12286  ORF Transcript_4511/g.12286 Transcript_4511/m.12286 type:complete len:150 (-) Transcript_4511:911-1360(-)